MMQLIKPRATRATEIWCKRLLGGLVVLGVISGAACGRALTPDDGEAYVREHYIKSEHRIPMRDGVKLHTVVYHPKDGGQTHPFLLTRTPYRAGPYGPDTYRERLGPTSDFMRDKFIFVYQDVRGRFMSEGEFVNMRPHQPNKRGASDIDESTDTYDTIEWLLTHVDGHNGKVGMWGISYPGFYSAAGMIDSHPALAAVSPQAPIADWFWDDMHRHGAFVLAIAFRFFSTFGKPREGLIQEWPERFDFKTPDAYQFYLDMGPLEQANKRYLNGEIEFWNQMAAHPNYDEFWQSRNLLPHLRNIKNAVLTVGGWFDTEDLYGPLHIYEAVEKHNPGIFNVLIMGPWSHGGWARTDGDTLGWADFGAKTSHYYRKHVALPFFRHYLKDGPEPNLPEVLTFETGANRWRAFDHWPPQKLRKQRLYLREDNSLGFTPPARITAIPAADSATDSATDSTPSPESGSAPVATPDSSADATAVGSRPADSRPADSTPVNTMAVDLAPGAQAALGGVGDAERQVDTQPRATESANTRSARTEIEHRDAYLAVEPGELPLIREAHDAYISDPAKPVPYTMEITSRWARNYMTEDQRFASWRPDVLVYQTEPLEQDTTIAGPIRVDLWVSTSGSDSDWIVKVIDVHPDQIPGWSPDAGTPDRGGYQMLVRADAFRGRFRESYEHPKPFEPNQISNVSFDLWDVLHTFRAGHRIMVHVQSSWFPLIDRNPQTYVPNIFEADEDDFVKVTNRVYRSAQHPSSIEIGVLEASYESTKAPFPAP